VRPSISGARPGPPRTKSVRSTSTPPAEATSYTTSGDAAALQTGSDSPEGNRSRDSVALFTFPRSMFGGSKLVAQPSATDTSPAVAVVI
jgi:hypothetical protein